MEALLKAEVCNQRVIRMSINHVRKRAASRGSSDSICLYSMTVPLNVVHKDDIELPGMVCRCELPRIHFMHTEAILYLGKLQKLSAIQTLIPIRNLLTHFRRHHFL